MKQYQIIKITSGGYAKGYAIASKKDIETFIKTRFLPYEFKMKFKKDLLNVIKTIEKYKNNVDYKTFFI